MKTTDIQVENHGSIILLRRLTTYGADWIEQNVVSVNEEAQTFGGGLVCEPRYVALNHRGCAS
jgi:hypothetical protein